MKKLLMLSLALMMCGCGNDEATNKDNDSQKEDSKAVSKVCSTSVEGMDMEVEFVATDGETVDKFDVTYVMTAEGMGLDSLEDLTSEEKQEVEDSMVEMMGLDDIGEGIEFDVEIDEDMVVSMAIDLSKISDEDLESIGFDFDEEDMKLETIVESAEEDGATCK